MLTTTDGEWIDAGELTLGDEIIALNSTFGTVEAVTVAANAQPVNPSVVLRQNLTG